MVAGRLDDVADPLRVADVAGIDPQAGRARLSRLNSALVVKVDVGDERDLRRSGDLLEGRCGLLVRARDADNVGSGLFQLADLVDRRPGVGRQGVGHRLDGDRGVAAHLDVPDADLAALAAIDGAPGSDAGVGFGGHGWGKIVRPEGKPNCGLRRRRARRRGRRANELRRRRGRGGRRTRRSGGGVGALPSLDASTCWAGSTPLDWPATNT